MNIFNFYREQITDLLQLYPREALAKITVDPPRETAHGDIATNAAMVLAKVANKNPRALAEDFQKLFVQIKGIEKIEIAGPGFINFRLQKSIWQNYVGEILSDAQNFGNSNFGKNEKINVEYVSANPTGPMHIGHARGAVFGDVLANVLEKSGFSVTREYYINDAGGQIEKLTQSLKLRIEEAQGKNIGEIPEGMYPGEYLKDIAQIIIQQAKQDNNSVDELLTRHELLKVMAVDSIMENLIKPDLKLAGIKLENPEQFISEAFEIHDKDKIAEALKILDAKKLTYVGVLEPPKGKLPDDWEEREQTLFKSTKYDDDVDRALKKSDGSYTYFAADLGYHLHKIQRGFTKLIDIWGIDHGGYVKRMKAGVSALSDNKTELEVRLTNLVKVVENGQPIKMSKRSGNFVTMREVIERVGKDALRFIMLTRKNDAPLDFDLAKVLEQSKDNPVFYVQYAHARCSSVLRQQQFAEGANLSLLTHEAELALIKKLAEFPRVIEQAAIHYEPHRVAFYLQELAADFHGLWNYDKSLKFITDDTEITKARIALVKATQVVISNGLGVMGVSAPEEMR